MKNIRYYTDQGMNASLTGAVVDCRGLQRISFQNDYDSATPDGDFTYEFSNDPLAATDPTNAVWTVVTPTTTHGAQPAGSAAGTFAVVFTDLMRYVRQKWTRVAGGSGDHLNTYVYGDSAV